MKRLVIYILLGCTWCSCNTETRKAEDKGRPESISVNTREHSNTTNTEHVAIAQMQHEEIEHAEIIEEIAVSFHRWYIEAVNDHETHTMRVIEYSENKYKVDTSSYFNQLRSLGTISEKFIQKEKERFKDCIYSVEHTDWSNPELPEEMKPYTGNNYDCLEYYYWLSAQEYPERECGIEVGALTQKGRRYEVPIRIYHIYDNERSYWDDGSTRVVVEKEKKLYKITDILLQ
jgi:hypothetical protein